jgi:hypothetical protein
MDYSTKDIDLIMDYFMKFEQWLLQRERDKKLTQLGI